MFHWKDFEKVWWGSERVETTTLDLGWSRETLSKVTVWRDWGREKDPQTGSEIGSLLVYPNTNYVKG